MEPFVPFTLLKSAQKWFQRLASKSTRVVSFGTFPSLSTVHRESQLYTNDTSDVDFTVDIGWI
jgi:hypothetical protein